MEYNILGILVKNPEGESDKLQNLFLQYGCVIRTRIGINRDNIGGAIIILDLHGDARQMELFLDELDTIKDVVYNYIKF